MTVGLTVRELAQRTGWPAFVLRTVFMELAEDGLVEGDGERWRLTPAAEREFGAALRGMWSMTRDEAEAA